jgi:hypothetical protein
LLEVAAFVGLLDLLFCEIGFRRYLVQFGRHFVASRFEQFGLGLCAVGKRAAGQRRFVNCGQP